MHFYVSSRQGFTLIELLVVISLIGVFSSMTLASFSVARQKAQDARMLAQADEVMKALELYHLDHGSYPGDEHNPEGHIGECTFANPELNVTPLLVPKYLAAAPEVPGTGCFAYVYISATTVSNPGGHVYFIVVPLSSGHPLLTSQPDCYFKPLYYCAGPIDNQYIR